jgi:cell division protein FtsN
MEGDRRLQVILIAVATIIFALSYIIGYMIGKEAGFQEAKAKFEVEKQRLLRTLAEINPISRPIEDKLVNESTETETDKTGETEETKVEEKETQEVEVASNTEESGEAKKQEKSDSSLLDSLSQPAEQETKPQPESATSTSVGNEEGEFYLQVGVFRSIANASRLAKKLKEKGYEAKVITTGSRKYSKVIVGYFSSKQDALKVKEELKKDGYNSILKRR